jgi:hypothetical protein
MNRSLSSMISALGFALLATPAFAQQPLEPAPAAPQPNGYGYNYGAQPNVGQPGAPPQYDSQSQYDSQQPVNPYPADEDDEDDGYDVTYDVSTEAPDTQFDDGYDANAYQQFEQPLAPYGNWEDTPQYGRVWVPAPSVVGYDFAPYGTGGHWVDSEYGWTWASDYDWGWAPFHYGRWMIVGGRGWCWLPGTVWGPAWVHWRWGGGYAGWAPMGPRGVVVGPPRGVRGPWRFCIAGQLGMARPAYLPARVIPTVWGRTTVVSNVATVRLGGVGVRVNAGPPVHLVSAAAGRTIVPAPLASLAPRALPRATIAPRLGTPVAARPWMQSRPVGGVYGRPVPGARTIGAPPAYHPAPQPIYRAPMPASSYRAPMPAQPYRYPQQPVYRAPAPVYRAPAPVYRPTPPPAYHYSQPVYRAPVYSAPPAHFSSPAPSFHVAPPAPTVHYSAPAPTFHPAPAPAFHGGGGGFRRR